MIRRPEFVTVARSRPEVMVFVESKRGRMPLVIDRLELGQVVWLK
ncbi:MAG: hypothetical protein ACE5R6_17430 [Candidatus Heimdallarchaeota archaeon]